MKISICIMLTIFGILALSNCGIKKKTTAEKSSSTNSSSATKDANSKTIVYKTDLMPILSLKCTPCHYPPDGRLEPLDTYEAMSKNIDGIIKRVSLPSDHEKFMPFMNKKPAFTKAEIQLFKDWKEQNVGK